jgi:hypothetical protein
MAMMMAMMTAMMMAMGCRLANTWRPSDTQWTGTRAQADQSLPSMRYE